MGLSNTGEERFLNEYAKVLINMETRNLWKFVLASKVVNPFYMCPWNPFYRETKGFLHSDNTLESKEYSRCEHVQECPLHSVICGANFTFLHAGD
jgi:hypothetical protein